MFYNINELSLRQSITDDRLQGRVHATTRFLEFGAMIIGIVLAGSLASAIGFRETLLAAVACQFVGAATLLFSPVVRLRLPPSTLEPQPLEGPAPA
jgi:hypothetical protein